MARTVLLQANGFVASFDLGSIADTNKYFDIIVGLQLDPRVGQVQIFSHPSKTYAGDMRALAQYLRQHIQLLWDNPDTHSPTFVPLELAFQLEALSGEVWSLDEGEFSIRLMLNVGARDREDTNVYVGAEASITLSSVHQFVADLDSLLNDFGIPV